MGAGEAAQSNQILSNRAAPSLVCHFQPCRRRPVR